MNINPWLPILWHDSAINARCVYIPFNQEVLDVVQQRTPLAHDHANNYRSIFLKFSIFSRRFNSDGLYGALKNAVGKTNKTSETQSDS